MTKNRALWLGLFAIFAVRCFAMFVIPLTDPTEARYAEIARKMVETGNWITPQFDYGVPFWAKPPLHTWLSAFGIAILGPTPFAARLGILMTSILTLVVLYHWIKALTDQTTALIVIVVTSTMVLFFLAIAFVQTDMVLTLGIIMSMAGFDMARRGHGAWAKLFFIGIAIGLLAKGPIAVVLIGSPIFLWLAWQRNWNTLLMLPWLSGAATVILLVVPWYIAAEIATPGFLQYFIVGEHIQRFLQPGWSGDLYGAGREHAKGMIWLFWLVATLPWAPLLPILLWRIRKMGLTDSSGLYSYLFLFAVVPLLFFTASANIIFTYTLPALPAAAALATLLWIRSSARGALWLKLGVAEVVVAGAVICILPFTSISGRLLPSQATILSHFPREQPLAIFGTRSYSAEFYREGQIVRLGSLDALRSWVTLNAGVLVPKNKKEDVEREFGSALREVASDNKFYLYSFTSSGLVP